MLLRIGLDPNDSSIRGYDFFNQGEYKIFLILSHQYLVPRSRGSIDLFQSREEYNNFDIFPISFEEWLGIIFDFLKIKGSRE